MRFRGHDASAQRAHANSPSDLQSKESILACERFSLLSIILVCGDAGLLPFHKSAKPLLLLLHQALLAKMPLFGDLAVMHAIWYAAPRSLPVCLDAHGCRRSLRADLFE